MPPVAIKIGEELAEEARAAAKDADRSLTGQVEHWAKLGKALEPLFSAPTIALLKKSGGDPMAIGDGEQRKSLEIILKELRTKPDFQSAKRKISYASFPKYESNPEDPSGIIRVAEDGVRTPGRFVKREFKAD